MSNKQLTTWEYMLIRMSRYHVAMRILSSCSSILVGIPIYASGHPWFAILAMLLSSYGILCFETVLEGIYEQAKEQGYFGDNNDTEA